MDIIASVSSGMTAIKQIKDLFDAVQNGKHQLELQTAQLQLTQALFEIQQSLMNVQNQNLQLNTENRHLNEMLSNKENWEQFAIQYRLVTLQHQVSSQTVETGAQVYEFKKEFITEDNPCHYLCPHCFENKIKSILQLHAKFNGYNKLICPACKNIYEMPTEWVVPIY